MGYETRTLVTHPTWFLNPTIQKFCDPFYMVVIPHSFKIQLSLIQLFTPQFQNFTNYPHGIFQNSNPNQIFFMEIGRNYLSIIVFIVNNFIVLVPYNVVVCFACLMAMNLMSIKTLPMCLQTPLMCLQPPLFVALKEILYQPCFVLIRLFAKDDMFSK